MPDKSKKPIRKLKKPSALTKQYKTTAKVLFSTQNELNSKVNTTSEILATKKLKNIKNSISQYKV